jgi:hypothetical protein
MFNKNDLELYSKFNEIDKKCHNICFEYCNPSNTYVSFPKDVKFNVEKDIVYINYKIESSYMVDFRTIKILVDDFINLSEKEIVDKIINEGLKMQITLENIKQYSLLKETIESKAELFINLYAKGNNSDIRVDYLEVSEEIRIFWENYHYGDTEHIIIRFSINNFITLSPQELSEIQKKEDKELEEKNKKQLEKINEEKEKLEYERLKQKFGEKK